MTCCHLSLVIIIIVFVHYFIYLLSIHLNFIIYNNNILIIINCLKLKK